MISSVGANPKRAYLRERKAPNSFPTFPISPGRLSSPSTPVSPRARLFVHSGRPGPLLKSYERTSPPLGFPRETDSLCPRCVKEVRDAVITGEVTLESLMNEHPGEIKAQIVEENGQVVMKKTCPKHGEFVDVMATDPAFLERIESLFFGRDFRCRRFARTPSRHFQHQVWPRRRFDRRSDQPLQHDVQSLLHGCEPGWLCSRTDV